jgi:hypothetical protein
MRTRSESLLVSSGKAIGTQPVVGAFASFIGGVALDAS